jgi:hypothetical protein
VKALRNEVSKFPRGMRAQLQQLIDSSRNAVVEALLPPVERNPPDEYTKTHGPRPPAALVRDRLDDDIKRAFGNADELVADMSVKLVFKDVAYESFVEEKLLETARNAMPGVEFLHDEFQAAPARAESPA